MPRVEVSPRPLEFPPTRSGEVVSQTVTISSMGSAPLQVQSVVFTTDMPDVLREVPADTYPLHLSPGDSVDHAIEFTPLPGMEPAQGTLTITTDDAASGSIDVLVRGEVLPAILDAEPDTLSWAGVPKGVSMLGCSAPISRIRRFEVVSTGGDDVQITGFDFVPEELGSHFTACPTSFANDPIPPEERRPWQMVFNPLTRGAHTGKLVINHLSGSTDVRLAGLGTNGGGVDVSPMRLAWPDVRRGECGEQILSIRNPGSLPLNITLLRIQPAAAGDFYTLSGASFDPDTNSLYQGIRPDRGAELTVTYCASGPPVVAKLQVNHSAAPEIPSPIDVDLLGHQALPD